MIIKNILIIILLSCNSIALCQGQGVSIVKPDASNDETTVTFYSPGTLLGHDDLGQYTAWYRIQVAYGTSVLSNSKTWVNVEMGGIASFTISSVSPGTGYYDLELNDYENDLEAYPSGWDLHHITFESMSSVDPKYISNSYGDRVVGNRNNTNVWSAKIGEYQTSQDYIRIVSFVGNPPKTSDIINIHRTVLWGNAIGIIDGSTELGRSERLISMGSIDQKYFNNGNGFYLIRFTVRTVCDYIFGNVLGTGAVTYAGGGGAVNGSRAYSDEMVLKVQYLGNKIPK